MSSKPMWCIRYGSSATPSVHTPAVPATVHETLAPDAVRRVSAPAAVRTPAAPAVTSASVPASVHAPLAPGSVSRNSASSAVSRNAAPSAVSRNLAPSTISSNLAPSAVSRNSALSAVTRNSAPTAVRKNSAPAAVSGNSVRRLSEPAAVPTSFAETPISTGLGRVRTLTQMHQELVHSQDLMCSGKEYFEDIRCGIEIAELISTDVDPRLCHNYFYKQLDHFRRSLEHMKCLIHQSDAKVHLLWRAAPPSLNALLKVFTTEYSILRELRRRFASVHKQIEGAGRQAYGLLKNCIPYEKRYDMPKIPLYDQIPSVFDPMPVKHTPITRILIPEFLRTQHKQVGSGELKGSTGGIFMPRNEKFLWSSLVKDTLNRHERAKRKKTESQKHRSPPKS
ncbi:hypothetical protein BIW11_07002 [Tropilaelaps mercedesae]|uniref:Uncharacterized protein n=1 Tax=Tropilaelaps mercedesae TaxID=418985 RepID=A0A1V9XVN7_9ACAR|nr:hypothetical protein BIW11_07002 [Tropilaelaps mercedesae]